MSAPEKIAKERDVAQKRYFGNGGCLGALHQAPQDDGLTIGRDGDGVGRTRINDRSVDPRGNRNLDRRVYGRDLGVDNHFDQPIGSDEWGHVEDNADILVRDGVDWGAIQAVIGDTGD